MKSRQRIIDHGEVFTPPKLVNAMLDLVAQECERIDSRFLEPACGDGNFLAEVLRRKLLTVDAKQARNRDKWERDAILAVCSLYGIDLLPDNVEACRKRLLDVVNAACKVRFRETLSADAERSAAFVLARNIVQGDALSMTLANGSPIIFPEWSAVNGTLVKRQDYRFDELALPAELTEGNSLFSDTGEAVYKPEAVRDWPLCHYLKLPDAEGTHARP